MSGESSGELNVRNYRKGIMNKTESNMVELRTAAVPL